MGDAQGAARRELHDGAVRPLREIERRFGVEIFVIADESLTGATYHALERGATILAEVIGAASTADAHHITAPDPDGTGAIRCMELALADAGISAADVSHINAHGTSTPLNDLAEAIAVRRVFGDDAPPVTSIKGHLGHSLAAAGALEGVASVLSLVNQTIPPTAGTTEVDPEIALDVVIGEPRSADLDVVLSNSFGFGGHNGSVVFRRFSA